MKRAVVIVIDSFGIGAMPDAREFGDDEPNTAGNIFKACGGLYLPNMCKMGLANIDGVTLPRYEGEVCGAYARLEEKSKGKDTVTGHWELMGVVSESGFSIFPNGFPPELMCKIENAWGVKAIGNIPASGTEIIQRLGEEHVKSKCPIVYTSADSVFQVAAHENVIPLTELYEMCATARRILDEEKAGVGRVIARPFIGENGVFTRTENRRDLSVVPPCDTYLDKLVQLGYTTLAIGKIEDIFAKRGISIADHTKNNVDGIDATIAHLKSHDSDFIFTNLVDFDMLYGHRRDATGYRTALEYFDSRLPEITELLCDEDLLIITADHGCDPTAKGTDHTREYVPALLKSGNSCSENNLGTVLGFDFVGKRVFSWLTGK